MLQLYYCEISPQRKCESPVNHSLSQKDPRRMTVLSLLPPPLADIALTHHDRFIAFMAISVIESIKLIILGCVAFKWAWFWKWGVVRLRGKKSPPFSNPGSAPGSQPNSLIRISVPLLHSLLMQLYELASCSYHLEQ